VARDAQGKLVHTDNGYLGPTSTNNIAELTGIIKALEFLAANPDARPAVVIGDSMLALNMGLGKWKAREEHLKPLRARAIELYQSLRDVKLEWVPRRANEEADEESNAGVHAR
jgi:ribonuclease HI